MISVSSVRSMKLGSSIPLSNSAAICLCPVAEGHNLCLQRRLILMQCSNFLLRLSHSFLAVTSGFDLKDAVK